MALRKVVKNDLDFLGKKSRPVTVFDDKLKALIEDMKETLKKEQGAGLAAPQVGILRRIFIIDVNCDGKEFKVFINPEIISATGKNDKYYEGCLSFPGRSFSVVRAHKVKMKAQDENGEFFEYSAEDFGARCLLHELDHLNGLTLPIVGKEVFEK